MFQMKTLGLREFKCHAKHESGNEWQSSNLKPGNLVPALKLQITMHSNPHPPTPLLAKKRKEYIPQSRRDVKHI